MDEPGALLILHRSHTSVMQIILPLLRGGEARVTSDVITLPIVMKFTDTVTSSSRYLPQPSPRGTHPPSHTLPPPEYAGPNGSSRHSTTKSSPSSPKGTHSFDVLRSDPGTVSLEHIASSKTLQNRVEWWRWYKPASPAGIANGSAPAFQVTLTHPPHVNTSLKTIPCSGSSQTFPSTHGGPSERETTFRSNEDPAGGGGGSSEYPSLVAFSMLDGSSVSKLTVDGNGRSHFEEIVEGGGGRGGGGGGGVPIGWSWKKTPMSAMLKAV